MEMSINILGWSLDFSLAPTGDDDKPVRLYSDGATGTGNTLADSYAPPADPDEPDERIGF